ncbi:MAG: oxidoreductase [Candidatus Harrisonbacteria bacterium CG10_big_fil_rev_8_21_14_0_10_40_38]|uniref:Oxidoreductase n=1 Tax=Candidatus Harrisonbacteria bacterium CG10_big_fil_rev_8_21_14_0_10_40_38 TaxID=1974583 RepID=A0A2H0US42_9BACT|nr:MAG: oxidoreductase [Candidatus Harrisonbacteria bacterium CG10_big_fil_rev_8_21_14_0_10_40_38]
MIYTVKLISKREVAKGTMLFEFSRPDGFEFRAGQFCEWKIFNPAYNDDEGSLRSFSICSPPEEKNLWIVTRIRKSAFKRSLDELPMGAEIQMDGPFGNLVLHGRDEKPAVFLTGGIGITPFFSMIGDIAHKKLSHKITMFYSNRTFGSTAFFDELKSFQEENKNFVFVPTFTDEATSSWDGERGFIDEAMIRRYVDNIALPIYYIAGPPQMTSSMWQMLKGMGVHEDDIKMEEFPGY